MIAGKYAQLMANPAASMALGGGIAAGASLLGNQGEDKSPGRQALINDDLGARNIFHSQAFARMVEPHVRKKMSSHVLSVSLAHRRGKKVKIGGSRQI